MLPCSSSFLKKKTMLLQMHHANWHAYQFQMAERACTCKDHTSSRTLSSLLHLLITSVIALAGIAEDSNPLGSGRSQTVYTCWCEIGLSFLLLVP